MNHAMNQNEIESKLIHFPTWSLENEKLTKVLKMKDFREAMSFLVKLSYEAEQRDHHPEIFNCYNRIEIALNTHSAGGKVTMKDFELAAAIDAISC
tara:strand:+ start:4348 stop:4635 length:288 start_codon:yes stop_codon:yes gene_type:complete